MAPAPDWRGRLPARVPLASGRQHCHHDPYFDPYFPLHVTVEWEAKRKCLPGRAEQDEERRDDLTVARSPAQRLFLCRPRFAGKSPRNEIGGVSSPPASDNEENGSERELCQHRVGHLIIPYLMGVGPYGRGTRTVDHLPDM
ncbi:hypothetical protein, partial [Candidatus Protofrankia datiscae]|uniref:hypothetical protein n=1 Tax=Candidatus Protofrankia datiscae TaxID=2716812 RepID=UPI0019D1A5D6